jgi:hypothetical protein
MPFDPADVIYKGLSDIEPDYAARLAIHLTKVEVSGPKLSETETNAIAEKVASRLIEIAENHRVHDASKWKPKLKKIAYDLAMGVTGSALYAVIEYLAHKAPLLLAAKDDEAKPDEGWPRRAAILDQISELAIRERVEKALSNDWLQESIEREARDNIAEDDVFIQFDQDVFNAAKANSYPTEGIEKYLLRTVTNGVFDEIFIKAKEKRPA